MNPLLEKFNTPFDTAPFPEIKEEHYLPAVKEAIKLAKEEIEQIKKEEVPTFKNTVEALDGSGRLLQRVTSIFFNLNSAETNDEIQRIAKEMSPLLSEHGNDILFDAKLFEHIRKVYQQKDSLTLTAEQEMLLDKSYKYFARNGAELGDSDKQRLREISKRLSELSLTFGERVLAEANSFEMVLDNEEDLSGLPEYAKEAAAQAAKEKGHNGKWVITLQYPSYIPFMTYADNRELRKKLFMAFGSKAFKGDEMDNTSIVKEIVKLRNEKAKLLGYKSHADYVLEERMAGAPDTVYGFLEDLLEKGKPAGEREVNEVTEFMHSLGETGDVKRWDWAYYAEKLKKERYEIDDEKLKPYFKLENVVEGVFTVANKLFGITFHENKDIPVYHADVKAYEVRNADGSHLAVYYADYFPRAGKRDGAWMTSYKGQYKEGDKENRPHVSIVCNFSKPTATKPSLLTFNEVTTLFHEFGHALHGMLADGIYESLSGTNVYWDFVELPSQLMENWAYEKECLDLFAKHYETGELIPESLVQRIKEAATFLEGYQTVRQISFGLLDMNYHASEMGEVADIDAFETEAFMPTNLLPSVPGTNMSCSFSHIFQGGYSAGYYSYKWAEVLDADAFELFKEKGIFDKETAESFRNNILAKGGSEHPMKLYERFRGHKPSVDALLRRAGLIQ
ncbi:M3 family metallopeptidase [Limibacter armeniacum]|uniref:M3 family metallopeptidase n=1 Tax=Limibacter armeniacum TaxID=466084 RepID=UPI002FE56992